MAARPSAQAKALSQEEGQLLMRALAIPPDPGFRGAGARVEHVLAPRDGALSEVLTEALGLPQASPLFLLPRPLHAPLSLPPGANCLVGVDCGDSVNPRCLHG